MNLTITVERDRSRADAKYRAKVRNGCVSFAGRMHGSIERAKRDVEALFDGVVIAWHRVEDKDGTRAIAELEIFV